MHVPTNRTLSLIGFYFLGSALLAARSASAAPPSYTSMQVALFCTAPAAPFGDQGTDCSSLAGTVQMTRITFYNPQMNPLFVETKIQVFDANGVTAYLDGNGDATTFAAIYTGASSILLDADLRVRVEVESNPLLPFHLVTDMPFRPSSGYAVRAVHSDDTPGLLAAIASGNDATLAAGKIYAGQQVAAEAAARQAADASLLVAARLYTDQQIAMEAAARLVAAAAAAASVNQYTDQQIAAEAAARMAADATLTGSLNGEIASRLAGETVIQASVNNESARAQNAEATLAAAIAAEASMRQTAESSFQNSINAEKQARIAGDANLQLSLDAETAARKQGDADTLASANKYTDAQLAAEAAARQAADASLTANLAVETARAQGTEATLAMNLASETAARQAGDTALQASINALATNEKNDVATLAANLASETGRAQNAESMLSTSLNSEVARAKAAEAAEAVRATGAEAALSTSIANEVGRAKAAESTEAVRATGAEAALSTSVANEVTRATAAEAALTNNVNGEINRATNAELGLMTNLNNEIAARQASVSMLQMSITGLLSNLTTYQNLLRSVGTLNQAGNPVDWSELKNVPATALGYNAGTGITIAANVVSNSGVLSVSATAPLSSSGGQNPTLSLGTLPIAFGGTGITTAPTVAGQYLRASGAGQWAVGSIQAADVPGLNNYVDLTSNQTIGGIKTFSNAVIYSSTGTAMGSDQGGHIELGASNGAANNGGATPYMDFHFGTGVAQDYNVRAINSADSQLVIVAATGSATLKVVGSVNASNYCVGADCRTSWNNPDASSVNPMPRSCPLGQIAVSMGAYQWGCSLNCSLGTGNCSGTPNTGCETQIAISGPSPNGPGQTGDTNGHTCGAGSTSSTCVNASVIVNCGACNSGCDTYHYAATCSSGVCIGACDVGYADCANGRRPDGCETNSYIDPNNCGVGGAGSVGCGLACSSVNMATRTCASGVCNGSCNAGFADCNNNKLSDGCEASVTSDPNNCGPGGGIGQGLAAGCGAVCSTSNMATRTCVAGSCNGTCSAGYADCNLNKQTDGCEVSSYNINNCGPGGATNNGQGAAAGCGSVCSTQNGTPACASGGCTITCTAGFSNCNNFVANTGGGSDGCEVSTLTDPNNCGAGGGTNGSAPGCGVVCSNNNIAARTCGGGICNGTCANGSADCNGNKQSDGCEAPTFTVTNCGPGGATNGGQGAPAGCGNVCSTQNGIPSCGAGVCVINCNGGFANCNNFVGNTGVGSDGCEDNTANDPNNCGAGGGTNNTAPGCGQVCSSNNMQTRTCAGGSCNGACIGNYGDCDGNKLSNGCEANLLTSDGQTSGAINHCGGCGGTCGFTSQVSGTGCAGGTCRITACNAGRTDCNGSYGDGCEADTATSDGQVSGGINHCGSCAGTCPLTPQATGTSCSSSACKISSCSGGFADCNAFYGDGCELNVTNNLSNCGSCGNACAAPNAAAYTCGGGTCGIAACNGNYWNIDGAFNNGCECYTGNGNSGVQNACGGQNDVGTLGFGASVTQTGTIAGISSEHWYAAAFANNGTSYHPHATVVTTGGNAVVMDVQLYNCAVTYFGCGAEGGVSSGRTDFETNQAGGDPTTGGTQGGFTWVSPGNVGQFVPNTKLLVRIRGTSANSCSTYTLTISNG